MKRIAVTSLAITLLVALASWETITAVTNVPHENPSTAETRFDIALPCLLRYGDILGMIAEKNYPQAKLLLEQLKIDYAHLPEELAFIMGRYNELIAQLSSRLDTLDNVLNECEVLLSQNKLQEAHPKLGEAKSFIDEAAELVEDVGKATDELAAHLAPLISPQEVETTNQAKARLLKAIAKLKEMEAWYRNKLENLATITGEKEELSSTELTLDVNPVEVWVGNTITATGILKTEENTYLAAKSIFVLLDGKHSTTITTTEDGSYRVIFDIPYHYIPEMIAQASYVPEGEDVNSFLASSSSAKKIKILFHPTQLALEAPQKAYPGLPIKISGKISSEGNFAGRNIQGFLDANSLFAAVTDSQGLFQYQMLLAPQTQIGRHKLTINIAPEDKSRSAGCSFDSTLTVVKATPQVKVRIPKVSILPQTIEVTGEVYSELPLQGATVTLQIAGISTATTLQDGKFKAKLRLPLKLNIMGFQEAKLNVKPLEPWHSPFETKAHLFVLNPVNLGVILAAFVSLGILSTKRRREVRRVGKTFPAFAEIEQPVKHALEKPRARLEGRRGIILEAYFRVINLIERVTRFSMESQMTLREFLKVVKPDIGGAAEAFSGMTNLAEVILYSPYKPQEGDVLKAKKLASRIMEALTSGKP